MSKAETHADSPVIWHQSPPRGEAAVLGSDGRMPLTELTLDRPGASSPFGDDLAFPLPAQTLRYQHS